MMGDAGSKGPGPAGRAQRRNARYRYVRLAWFHRLDDATYEDVLPVDASDDGADRGEEAPTEGMARSCDISKSGVGLVLTRPLPVGERIFLELVCDDGSVSLIGRVVHCSRRPDGFWRTGLDIEIVPPTDRLTLSRITKP